MTKKKFLRLIVNLTQKLVFGLFIGWVGVIAPLVYFDGFATRHIVQPYHFVLFESPPKARSFPPGENESQLSQQLMQRFSQSNDVISAKSPFSGIAHAFQGSLSQLYLVTGTMALSLLFFRRLNLLGQLLAASADLSPPDKPPRPFLLTA